MQRILINFTWTSTSYYIKVSEFISCLLRKQPEEKVEKQEESEIPDYSGEKQSLLYYIEKNKVTYYTDISNYKSIECHSTEPLIMFLITKYNNMKYYKRTDRPLEKGTEYLTLDTRPFIQVEFIEKGKKPLDIHSQLGSFYVEGNKILDTAFLKWYLGYYYDIYSFDDYTLKIFDKDVNMFTLDKTQYVLLEDNTYKVVEYISDSSDEGETEDETEEDVDEEL